MVNKAGPRPTLVQKFLSPAVTWGLSHVLTYPSRKAVAGSLRELAKDFSQAQQAELIHLLFSAGVLQTKFSSLSPAEMEHYHIKKDLRLSALRIFMIRFNRSNPLKEYKIHFIGAEFTLERLETSPPVAEPETVAAVTRTDLQLGIFRILHYANRPLSLKQIQAELSNPVEEGISAIQASSEDISFLLGRMAEGRRILRTFPGTDNLPRFFSSFYLSKWTNEGILCPLAYAVEDGDHSSPIYKADAEDHARHGTVRKVLTVKGEITYVTAQYMLSRQEEFVLVAAGKKGNPIPLFCRKEDIPKMAEEGKLIYGTSDLGEEFFILADHQHLYQIEIFNVFIQESLQTLPQGQQSAARQRYRAAFVAGCKAHRPSSIGDFLSEAKLVRSMGGGERAIVLSLLKNKMGLAQLRDTTAFAHAEIGDFEKSIDALNLLSHLPLPFKPGYSHCLQNFLYFLYDASLNYDVYLLVLARKYEGMVKLSQAGEQIPESVALDMELVVAPQAKKRNLSFFHDQACDLLARHLNPAAHQLVLDRIQTFAQLPLDKARELLCQVAESVRERMEAELEFPISVKYRTKEVSSIMQKSSITGDDFCDFFGVRFVCGSIEEAQRIIAWLSNPDNLRFVAESDLPGGKKAVENHLEAPNINGWKGWRGYFYSPQEFNGGKPIIIALQVLTAEMDKADRLGEYGHWLYKSVRASIKWARELGARWKQQLFDPAPASAYCGVPADDYRVDRERARICNTNFIMRLEAGQEIPKDIETIFATGIPAILRSGKEDPLYNLVAFRSFEDELTQPHSVEVYTLSYSEAAGRIAAVPYKKGQARCNIIKERAPNHSLIIIKEDPVAGRALNDADLAKIINSPQSCFRAVFLARFELERRKMSRGSVQASREVVITGCLKSDRARALIARYFSSVPNALEKIQEAVSRLELRNETELFAAIGLDLLDETKIKEILSIFNSKEEHRAFPGKTYKTTVIAPNHRQLLPAVFEGMKKFDILAFSFDVEERALGVNPVVIRGLSKPHGDIAQFGPIKERIDLLPPDALFNSPVHIANDPAVFYTIKVDLSSGRAIPNWNVIRDLTAAMQSSFKRGSFSSIKLGNVLEGERSGSFVFQVHGIDSAMTEDMVNNLVRGLISTSWHNEEGHFSSISII